MINLLPQAEKKKLQKEFHLRYSAILLLVLFFTEMIAFASFVPSYMTLKNSALALETELVEKKNNAPPEGEETQKELNTIKSEIALLKTTNENNLTPSAVITELLSQKPAGVLITRFSYAVSDKGYAVQLSGNAGTREDLLSFQRLLKANLRIKDARYAQSFITKKTDIDFMLTVDLN